MRPLLVALLASVLWPPASPPGEPSGPSAHSGVFPDSADLHDDARTAQSRFERTRIRQSPIRYGVGSGPCDERVGRMCIRLPSGDGDTGWQPPPEPERIVEARQDLLNRLDEIGERIPGDAWVLGQRVAYLGESEEWERALELAEDCALAPGDRWWCHALGGKALHRLERFSAAEEAFDAALSGMPEEKRREWTDVEPLVEPGLRPRFQDVEEDSLTVWTERLWRLADPLYLVPGNDRWTEHLARWTLARIRADARNPYAMSWSSDLAEVLVRYGPEAAYEREPTRPLAVGPDAVLGRFHPESRRFLPDEDAFSDPVGVDPGGWTTTERRARSRHAPSYVTRIGELETDPLVFRRGEDVLVVLVWETGRGAPEWGGDDVDAPDELETGMFLLASRDLASAESSTDMRWTDMGDGAGGVATARAPAGEYLVSLELLDREGRRAWRARHGLAQEPIPRGVVALSDLALLRFRDGAPDEAPEALRPSECAPVETALDRIESGRRVEGREVEVAWEVYGLEPGEGPLRFRLSAEPEDTSLLRRAGEFLRLVSPTPPAELQWEEGGVPREEEASLLHRCVSLDLSSLPAGETRIQLTLELPGRTEVRTERFVELGEP